MCEKVVVSIVFCCTCLIAAQGLASDFYEDNGWVPTKVLTSPVLAYEIKEIEEISLIKPGGQPIELRKRGKRLPAFLPFLLLM